MSKEQFNMDRKDVVFSIEYTSADDHLAHFTYYWLRYFQARGLVHNGLATA
jgi:hypothetical protein